MRDHQRTEFCKAKQERPDAIGATWDGGIDSSGIDSSATRTLSISKDEQVLVFRTSDGMLRTDGTDGTHGTGD